MFPAIFPEMKTERLLLRQILPTDLAYVYRGLSDPAVVRHYGVSFESSDATEEQMEWYENLWQNQTGIWWAICSKGRQQFLGACGFSEYQFRHKKIELGYWLLPEHWRQGFAFEAVSAILPLAYHQLDVERIEAFVETGNSGSDALLQKLGFTYEGTMRNCEYKNDSFISLKIFARLAS